MKRLLCALLLLSLGAGPVDAADNASDLAGATIVVYNRKAPDSIALAYFYAKARQIPDDHLVGLECSTEEEISREEYDDNIAEPLRKAFVERHWWTLRDDTGDPSVRSSRIHFVALMRGLPLKIRAIATYEGDHLASNPIGGENQASVDSELAVLGLFSRQISGAAKNPYFQSFRPIMELDELPLLLVCRLDAPTEGIVRRMITDAVETEKSGLWGRAYVDGAAHQGGGLGDGDLWLK